jgi:hypothetical protein
MRLKGFDPSEPVISIDKSELVDPTEVGHKMSKILDAGEVQHERAPEPPRWQPCTLNNEVLGVLKDYPGVAGASAQQLQAARDYVGSYKSLVAAFIFARRVPGDSTDDTTELREMHEDLAAIAETLDAAVAAPFAANYPHEQLMQLREAIAQRIREI